MASTRLAALRRAAVLGLVALASAVLLPFVHALARDCDHVRAACAVQGQKSAHRHHADSSCQPRHCAVRSTLAWTKSRTLVFARALPPFAPELAIGIGFSRLPATVARVHLDDMSARAPPVLSQTV
ncbi:MAG TPA: hypothetical protein VMR31_05440 [Myxococcota bacterium]|nr:hypothetical protein [Myxococcota bacterium]